MRIDRKEQRMNAKAFLCVHDKDGGKLIGYMLDLTTTGMKLKSPKAIGIDIDYEFKVDLPVEIADSTTLILKAKSLWCKYCKESCYYETGFEILDCSPSEAERIKFLLTSDLFAEDAEQLHISLGMIKA